VIPIPVPIDQVTVEEMSQDPVEPPSPSPPRPVYDWRKYTRYPENSLIPKGVGTFTLVTGPPGSYIFTLDRTLVRQSTPFVRMLDGDTSLGRCVQASDGTLVVEVTGDDKNHWWDFIQALSSSLYVGRLRKPSVEDTNGVDRSTDTSPRPFQIPSPSETGVRALYSIENF